MLHIVHRLDRLTSGLTIFAKTPEAAKAFGDDLAQGRTAKTYLARVVGDFGAGLPGAWLAPLAGLEGGARLGWALDRPSGADETVPTAAPVVPDGGDGGVAAARAAVVSGSSVVVSQPIGCLNHKDGVYDCAYAGNASRRTAPPVARVGHRSDAKEAVSRIRKLSFNGHTSLVEVRPLHGRTHQIRLHLQHLGHPIANDPCYGGALHYGDKDRGIPEMVPSQQTAPGGGAACSEDTSTEPGDGASETECHTVVHMGPRGDGEDLKSFLVRTCRFCREGRLLARGKPPSAGERGQVAVAAATRAEGERHCGGIWLHALKYERRGDPPSADDWSFQTSWPLWAVEGFREPE